MGEEKRNLLLQANERYADHLAVALWAVPVLAAPVVVPLFGDDLVGSSSLFLALLALTPPVCVVLDGRVIYAVADDPPRFRDRIPTLLGWALFATTLVVPLLLGLAIWKPTPRLARAIGVIFVVVWLICTFHVPTAIVVDGDGLRAAVRSNWRRLRAAPRRTAVAGLSIPLLNGLLLGLAAFGTVMAIIGYFMRFLIYPLLFMLAGVVIALPVAGVTPVTYAYTRALKVEIYLAAVDD